MTKKPKRKLNAIQEYFAFFHFLFDKCTWCSKDIDIKKSTPIGFNVQTILTSRHPLKEVLSKFDGLFLPVPIKPIKRIIWCFVTTLESQNSKKEQPEAVFFCCSETCASKLWDALDKDYPGKLLRTSSILGKAE